MWRIRTFCRILSCFLCAALVVVGFLVSTAPEIGHLVVLDQGSVWSGFLQHRYRVDIMVCAATVRLSLQQSDVGFDDPSAIDARAYLPSTQPQRANPSSLHSFFAHVPIHPPSDRRFCGFAWRREALLYDSDESNWCEYRTTDEVELPAWFFFTGGFLPFLIVPARKRYIQSRKKRLRAFPVAYCSDRVTGDHGASC